MGALSIIDIAEIGNWDSNISLSKFLYLRFLISSFILLSKPLIFGGIFSDCQSCGSRKVKVLNFYDQIPCFFLFSPSFMLLYESLIFDKIFPYRRSCRLWKVKGQPLYDKILYLLLFDFHHFTSRISLDHWFVWNLSVTVVSWTAEIKNQIYHFSQPSFVFSALLLLIFPWQKWFVAFYFSLLCIWVICSSHL